VWHSRVRQAASPVLPRTARDSRQAPVPRGAGQHIHHGAILGAGLVAASALTARARRWTAALVLWCARWRAAAVPCGRPVVGCRDRGQPAGGGVDCDALRSL
jgi:hypothetical protein